MSCSAICRTASTSSAAPSARTARSSTPSSAPDGRWRRGRRCLKAISAAWSRLTGQPERNLVLRVEEADPATIMEAGLILPRPGEEAAWFEKNKAVLAEAAPAAA